MRKRGARLDSKVSQFWTEIGTAASSLLSVLAWLNNIGLWPLFIFIAGSFFTLLTQERLEKKRRKREEQQEMTEHIYGPLHNVLNSIRESIEDFQEPVDEHFVDSLDNLLEDLIKDFRFGLVEPDFNQRTKAFHRRLLPHTSLRREAFRETESCIARSLGAHKIENRIQFSIFASGTEKAFDFIEPIFRGEVPLDYLAGKTKPYVDASIVVYVHGKSQGILSPEHPLHKVSLNILQNIENIPLVQTYRRDRQNLLEECNMLIDLTRKVIVL